MEVLNVWLSIFIFLATVLAGYIVFLYWQDLRKLKQKRFNDPYLINAFICDVKRLIGSTNSELQDRQYRYMCIWHTSQIKTILEDMRHELEAMLNWK